MIANHLVLAGLLLAQVAADSEPAVEIPMGKLRGSTSVELEESDGPESNVTPAAAIDDRPRTPLRGGPVPARGTNQTRNTVSEADAPNLAPVAPEEPRVTASDLLAGLMVAPAGEGISKGLTGKPLSLSEAFVRVGRASTLEAAEAYWGLAAAMAECHQRQAELAQYERLAADLANQKPRPADAAALAAVVSGARAAQRESKIAAVAAQQKLATVLRFPPDAPLPLATDVPHSGTYLTFFENIFGNRPAPPELVLIHRTLPIQLELISARTSAALAALDHYEAALAELDQGQVELRTVLECQAEWGRQQRALIRTVERYNRDIAQYALRLAPPASTPHSLVAMLIKTPSSGVSNPRPPATTESRATAGTPRLAPLAPTDPFLPANEVRPASAEEMGDIEPPTRGTFPPREVIRSTPLYPPVKAAPTGAADPAPGATSRRTSPWQGASQRTGPSVD